MKDYPVVQISDQGAFWSLAQTKRKLRHPVRKANEDDPRFLPSVVVSAGGGQVFMTIDKCSGAITRLVLNR